jgi:hypothetical protein
VLFPDSRSYSWFLLLLLTGLLVALLALALL